MTHEFSRQVGSKPGLWSRSLCLMKGLGDGSMLTAIERALSAGYAVAVLNPNANSVGSVLARLGRIKTRASKQIVNRYLQRVGDEFL